MSMASILHGNNTEFGSSEFSRSRSRSWRRSSKWAPPPDVPKGSLAVYVGENDDRELKRFVIPISYLRHQLLRELLKRSEEEFGFCRHEGALHLHCDVSFFCRVLSRIESDNLVHHVKIPRGPIGLTVP